MSTVIQQGRSDRSSVCKSGYGVTNIHDLASGCGFTMHILSRETSGLNENGLNNENLLATPLDNTRSY